MGWTLDGLIEALNDMAEEETVDGKRIGSLPVGVAYQPNWPLSAEVSAITVSTRDEEVGPCVWIAASATCYGPFASGYAPKDAWEGGIEGFSF